MPLTIDTVAMKTLLRLFVLVSLVVIGKLTKDPNTFTDTTAKSVQSVLQAPVRNASFFFGQSVPKSVINEERENLWHSASLNIK
jgi:hypothetical protein